jgi:hypothetical protein
MHKLLTRYLALSVAVFMLTGCSTTPPPAPPDDLGGVGIHERNQGYSLLYKLMSDESNVGKLFFLKSADEPVKNLVKEIGAAAQATKKQLDDFAASDKHVEFDMTDLPAIEQRGRELEAKDQEKGLLFSSGNEFEVRLIFSQAEATGYAMQLCRALDEKEDNQARKLFLESQAKQFGDFHDRLMKMLTIAH